jgi:choline-sulfatase
VIFTSDHGDMLGERRMVQKRCFYEWAVRVPLVARLPGEENAGLVVDRPVSLLALVPTLLAVADVPDGDRLSLDGASLFDAGDRPVFAEYHVEKVRAPCFMVRSGRRKYIHVHGHDARLFGSDADPASGTTCPVARSCAPRRSSCGT